MSAESTFDVAVIGAGPAGASAALHLARGGARVALVEKARLPRAKTCGGGLVPRARRYVPSDVELPLERVCDDVVLRIGGLELPVRRDALVEMTMRAELDHALTNAAVAAGAVLRAETTVTALERRRDEVVLATSRGAIGSRVVIAADGVHSPIARAAGWTRALDAIPALEAEVEVDPASLERHARAAVFDWGAVDAGYGWVFPKRAHLSVGVLSTVRGDVGLRAELDRYVERAVGPITRRDVSGWLIPVRPRRDGVARDRVLLVGDAAGLADPLTCEGISLALWSGKLAAEACLEGAAHVERRYAARLEREIVSELRRARWLAHLVYHRPRAARWLFSRAGGGMCDAMVDVVSGRASYRAILGSPRSWARMARQLATASR